MAKYKVVPAEITDEMAEASGCEGCFRKSVHDQAQDMWTAMINVSPDVQREPAGWYAEDHLDDKSATTYNAEVAQRWRAKGWPVTPLYTTPQLARELPPFCIVCEFSSTSPDVLFVEAEIEGESVSLVWRDRADGLKELIVPRHTATHADVQGESVDQHPDVSALVEALESLIKGYMRLLEAGRDRIMSLGGDCDPVYIMAQDDPWLCDARKALAAYRNQGGES